MTEADVLRRVRELFISSAPSILGALHIATRETGWTDLGLLIERLRVAARNEDGEDWRIKAIDRAIEEAARICGDG